MKAGSVQSLAVAILVAWLAPLSQAQSPPENKTPRLLADLPMLVLRNNTLNAKSVTEYMQALGQELQIGPSVVTAMSSEKSRDANPRHPNPVSGSLFYMVRGLIPGFEAIEFIQVADEADFERLVQTAWTGAGDSRLEGGNGRYKQTISVSWKREIQHPADATGDEGRSSVAELEGQDQPKGTLSLQIGVGRSAAPGVQVTLGSAPGEGEIIEENGRRYRQHTSTSVRYLRYHDGFMFTSSYEELHEMRLPARDVLLGRAESGLDAELDFFPDRIPVGFKHLFWNTLSSSASTELQPIDGEDPVDYTLRRASGDVGLRVLQTLLFDTERITGQFSVATDEHPIRGELKLRSRENSNFAGNLKELATARSRFAPVLDDGAALTVHASLKLPEGPRKVLVAAGQWVQARLMDAATANVDLAIAGGELHKTLEGISVHGNLELLVKVGWTRPSGGVLYGGLQVDDNPALLQTIFNLLVSDDVDPGLRDRFTMVVRNELPMIEYQVPADSGSPLRVSHVYLTHQNSCLWFAAGGANADEILQQSMERCERGGMLTKTALMTARVDFERWMSYPQDDPTGIAALPSLLDARLTAESIRPVVQPEDSAKSIRVTPAKYSRDELLQAVVRMGGSREASLVFDADNSGFVVRAEIGAAIGRYLLARVMASVENALPTDGRPSAVEVPEVKTQPEAK